uniref:Uncharacterized protein n=1 Tax=Nelumbo nucifera TaxID=4432 RepID=A0A822Z0W7_NELNU|nr:TPA_asm: hypothetical protein HUJ06_007756 [Nelumbo nucifera]
MNPVIPNVPLDELPQPSRQIGGGLIPEIPVRQAHVSMGEGNVAIPRHLHDILLCFHAQMPFKDRNQLSHRHRRRVPQVVDSELRRSSLLPPASRALLRRVQRAKASLHDVVDVSEVSGDFLIVLCSINGNGLALKNILSEEEVSHVGSSPRAVDGEEAESCNGETVDVVVSVSDLLEQIYEPGYVGVHVRLWVLHGVTHTRLSCQVEDVSERNDVEELGQ